MDTPLLNLATVLLAGIVGGELLGRLKLPKVTGWIGTGVALRYLELPGLEAGTLGRFSPFTSFVLGFIAFTVGATLHFASLRNARKRLLLLILAEALVTPVVVVAALHYAGGLAYDVSMILGAIAIAGAPGTTVLVVQEARARGLLSRTLIAAVGLIDMVAVGAFAFAFVVIQGHTHVHTLLEGALAVGVEFGLAASVGLVAAAVAMLLTRTIVGPAFVGPMMVAVILGAWGGAKVLGASSILACTFAGIAVSNLRHETARTAEAYLHPFGGVLFAGFYTLAGMRLDFALAAPLAGLVALYFGSRLVGKSVAAYVAMRLSGATRTVRRYLGMALLPHGGVAVGLIFIVQESSVLADSAETIAALGLATLAINQLLGPSATRYALGKAGEVGKDRPRLLDFLTEQRIITGLRGTSKREIIETLADRLYETTSLPISKDDFVKEVLEREADESTCLGEGFMIPHAVLEVGEQVRGVLGISAEGLDLGAYDGRAVHAVVLLATPKEERQRHLEILAAFAAAITRKENLREQLYSARSPAHAYEILHAGESEELNYFLDDARLAAGVD